MCDIRILCGHDTADLHIHYLFNKFEENEWIIALALLCKT